MALLVPTTVVSPFKVTIGGTPPSIVEIGPDVLKMLARVAKAPYWTFSHILVVGSGEKRQ